MITKVSTGTQIDSPYFTSSNHNGSNIKKRRPIRDVSVVCDYVDVDNAMDLDKLKTWCHAQWLTTIRRGLLHGNKLEYHSCCNSFSRRYFGRHSDHPNYQSFNLKQLRDFENIETGDDFFRWQVNIAKENKKHEIKTFFPSINTKHRHSSTTIDPNCEGDENKALLRKRLADLEQEVEEKKKLLYCYQSENARLLRSSKAWHHKYEELLETYYPPNEFLTTPKKAISNWLVAEDS